jgi:putative phosphoesterase
MPRPHRPPDASKSAPKRPLPNLFGPGQEACFARTNEAAHLKANPRQRVTSFSPGRLAWRSARPTTCFNSPRAPPAAAGRGNTEYREMAGDDVLIGVISDTHGLLRPEALAALRAVDLIIHAGDVGTADVLGRLRDIAPVYAVRGNVDSAGAVAALPATELVAAGPRLLFVLHDIAELDLDPASAGFAAVIYGHSHQPAIETRNGVKFINPGSAGPRRFRLPVTVARLQVSHQALEAEIVELAV